MTTIQIKRGETPGVSPTGLAPGELAVEMAVPTQLWVGVPVELDPSGKKLLSGGGGLPLTGGTLTGQLVVSSPEDYMSSVQALGAGAWLGAYDTGTTLEPGFWLGRMSQDRWGILATADAETGAHAGSNLKIVRTGDGGVALPDALNINRATGLATVAGDPVAALGIATKQYVDIVLTTSEFLSTRGGTVLGYLTLDKETPVMSKHAASKGYVDEMAGKAIQRINEKVSLKGATMRGLLTLWGDPVIGMHAAPKKYVDQEIEKLQARIATLEFKLGQQ